MSSYISKISTECTTCGNCIKECIMLARYISEPKRYFSAYNETEKIDPIIPYSCMSCGLCATVCPKELNLGEGFLEVRQNIVKKQGKVPIKRLRTVKRHQRRVFSRLFTIMVKEKKL